MMHATPNPIRRRLAGRAAIAAVGLAGALAFAGQAHATTCSFGGGGANTLAISQDHYVQLYRHYGGSTIYWFDHSDATSGSCGSTATTTSIAVQGTFAGGEGLVVDELGGRLDRASGGEIKIALDLGGTAGDRLRIQGQEKTKDKITVGHWGIGLNADGDVDIALNGALSWIEIETYSGDDIISGRGGGAYGPATNVPLHLSGDGGIDKLSGGDAADSISGGANNDTIKAFGGNDDIYADQGKDTVDAGAGDDTINAFDNAPDTVKGGSGYDTAYVDGYDLVSQVEVIA